jgi:hypothetical protein
MPFVIVHWLLNTISFDNDLRQSIKERGHGVLFQLNNAQVTLAMFLRQVRKLQPLLPPPYPKDLAPGHYTFLDIEKAFVREDIWLRSDGWWVVWLEPGLEIRTFTFTGLPGVLRHSVKLRTLPQDTWLIERVENKSYSDLAGMMMSPTQCTM